MTQHLTVPALFRDRAVEQPDREAVDGTSYAELKALVDSYVTGLKASGVKSGDAVCLLFKVKSVHAIALSLATMRAGATDVPLDPSFPLRRLSGQCHQLDQEIKIVVHGDSDIDRERSTELGNEINVTVKPWQSLKSDILDQSDVSDPNEAAMVLFTSGSSGPPKGTIYTHKQLSSSLLACAEYFHFSPTSRICNMTPPVWDCGNLDRFGPLITGGTVCFCHEISPAGVAATILQKKCTWILLPPSFLINVPVEALSQLEILVSAGEAPTPRQFRMWRQGCPQTRIFNAYGLTETGMVNTAWEFPEAFPEGMTHVPIGEPFGENKTFIDPEKGELILAGPQVAQGYLRSADTEAFVAPPSGYSSEHYAMRTGDNARQDETGLVYSGGRLDGQLSIFSLRIEPAEPESVACSVAGIDFAHVFVHELGDGEAPALVLAYHTPESTTDQDPLTKEEYEMYAGNLELRLREQMSEFVPEYQRPSAYLPLGRVPRLITSKKDGKRIAAIAVEAQSSGGIKFAPFHLNL